jgi:hypothetical protein
VSTVPDGVPRLDTRESAARLIGSPSTSPDSRRVLAPQPFAQTLEPWVRVQVVEHWQHDVLGQ